MSNTEFEGTCFGLIVFSMVGARKIHVRYLSGVMYSNHSMLKEKRNSLKSFSSLKGEGKEYMIFAYIIFDGSLEGT